ncbi:MAG TPA: phosphoribosylamine--glycine ligase [Dehalococcoidia bacterium]|nr:phosphoribosylamine--glycine ligase [Dehalococcoidia bacterium]
MNVLLIGGGGREHAIAWKLRQSPKLTDLHIAPGNAGTAALGHNVDLPIPRTGSPPEAVEPYLEAATRLARELRADLVFVAPDDPLSWGLVDRLLAAGIAAFGPTKAAAEIEASKAWAAGFMARHGIPHPWTATFSDLQQARAFVREQRAQVVVKASGLAAGKGAIVTSTTDEALRALDDLMEGRAVGDAGRTVVVMERLFGPETSAHAFTDGKTVLHMPLSCDHKTVFDGGVGPNTGGMGVYSPPPWVSADLEAQIQRTVTEAAVAGMAAEGRPYRGVIYPGIMVTADGVRVIEFNARFGDPEAQALLPRLEGDLLEVAWACANGTLAQVEVRWRQEASVCVVLASGGYPGPYETGLPISGIEDVDPDVLVFHAGTRRSNDAIVTNGGRVLNVVALGADLEEARRKAYANVERVRFEGMHYRRDIGLVERAGAHVSS